MKKPELPRRSVRNFDQRCIRLCIWGCLCESCKHEVGKEMFARTTLPSAHKNTLRVLRYCAGQVRWRLIIVCGALSPMAWRGNKYGSGVQPYFCTCWHLVGDSISFLYKRCKKSSNTFCYKASSGRRARGIFGQQLCFWHCAVFFLPNILCVHVCKLGTSVRKSTTKSDLQNLQNWYQCRSEQTSRSFVIQRKIYTRAKSRILSRRKPCACMRSLSRHGLLGGFSAKLIFILNFRKAPHGPWMSCNHFCIHLKCQRTGTSAKATNLIEGWMIRREGTWSTDHCPWLVRLAFFEVANFRGSFFFPEEEHVERSNWEPSSWASCFGFLDLSKKRGASESKSEISKGTGLAKTHIIAHTVRQQLQVFSKV